MLIHPFLFGLLVFLFMASIIVRLLYLGYKYDTLHTQIRHNVYNYTAAILSLLLAFIGLFSTGNIDLMPKVIRIREDGSRTERIIIGKQYAHYDIEYNYKIKHNFKGLNYLQNMTADTIYAFRALYHNVHTGIPGGFGSGILLEAKIPPNQVVQLSQEPSGPVERIPNIRMDLSTEISKECKYVIYLVREPNVNEVLY